MIEIKNKIKNSKNSNRLRERNPELWARLQLLMDHDEDRKKELDFQQMFQVNFKFFSVFFSKCFK